jgi:short-subunit dehydrogenase
MELRDRHIVVTGASRGIGAALAREFAARGARVTLVARSADALAALAAELGGRALPADLSDPAVVGGLIARIEDEVGPIDVLVNNAGVDLTGGFAELSRDDLERLIGVTVIAVTDLTRQVLPRMIARGRGHVVMMSSLAAAGTFPGIAVYAATKAYVTHLTEGIRLELKGLPIGLTIVEPGLVTPTDMADSVTSYGPTAASFARFNRLGLLADVDRDTLAGHVVRAVEQGKLHVRYPKRARVFPQLTNAPRRIAAVFLVGVPRREDRSKA